MKKYRITNIESGENEGTAFMFTWLEEVMDDGKERQPWEVDTILLAEEEWLNEEETEGSRVHLPENWTWENMLDGKRECGLCELLSPLSLEAGEAENRENEKVAALLDDLWKRGKGATVTIER